jgi:hypothetical protein
VVGDADRRLAVGSCGTHELTDARRAVEHRELGVHVQVGERIRQRRRPLLHSLGTNDKAVIPPGPMMRAIREA